MMLLFRRFVWLGFLAVNDDDDHDVAIVFFPGFTGPGSLPCKFDWIC